MKLPTTNPDKAPSHKLGVNISTLVVASLGYFVDLFDLWLFSLYRLEIFSDLEISDGVQSGVLAINAQLLGLLLGGFLFGWSANHIGRRRTLFYSILLYSVGTLFTSFVTNYSELVILRLFTGIGLAGELGVAATLIFEMVSAKHRWLASLGLILVGLSGSIAAIGAAHLIPWRSAFLIGGAVGVALLFLRGKVAESSLFSQGTAISPWHLLRKDSSLRKRLAALSAIGLPITAIFWMVTSFSPELSTELGFHPPLSVSDTLLCMQGGYICGDVFSILLSHYLARRRLVVGISLFGCAVSLIGLCEFSTPLPFSFFGWSFALGLSAGFWGVLLSTCIEQFGSDFRAGAATLVPNLARASPLLLIGAFGLATPLVGMTHAILGLGLLSIGGACWGLSILKESYGADLNWAEIESSDLESKDSLSTTPDN